MPNLNLYDLPGVTFVEGIKEEAEKIYGDFLDNEETTVLLILNGGDDLTNSSVIEWMKKAKNYKKRFIPIVAKADLIQNFEGKMKQLRGLKLNNKPCLIINKNKDSPELKNLSVFFLFIIGIMLMLHQTEKTPNHTNHGNMSLPLLLD